MKYNTVTITPEDEQALSNVIADALEAGHPNADVAYKWIAYVREVLYSNWKGLADGSHLRAAYSDSVWGWNDSDIE